MKRKRGTMTVLVTMTKMVIVIEDPSYREGTEGGLLLFGLWVSTRIREESHSDAELSSVFLAPLQNTRLSHLSQLGHTHTLFI